MYHPIVVLVSHELLELCSKTYDVPLQFSIGIVLIVETLVEVVNFIAEETIAIDGVVSLTSAQVQVRLESTLFSPCKICLDGAQLEFVLQISWLYEHETNREALWEGGKTYV
jgi:hypothetical protein